MNELIKNMDFFLVLGPQMSCPGGPVQYKVLVPSKQPPAWFTWGKNFVINSAFPLDD